MLSFIISESCVEVFLVYLLALLKADNFNLSLLAGKVSYMCILHFMYSYLLTLLSYHISCIILLLILLFLVIVGATWLIVGYLFIIV